MRDPWDNEFCVLQPEFPSSWLSANHSKPSISPRTAPERHQVRGLCNYLCADTSGAGFGAAGNPRSRTPAVEQAISQVKSWKEIPSHFGPISVGVVWYLIWAWLMIRMVSAEALCLKRIRGLPVAAGSANSIFNGSSNLSGVVLSSGDRK